MVLGHMWGEPLVAATGEKIGRENKNNRKISYIPILWLGHAKLLTLETESRQMDLEVSCASYQHVALGKTLYFFLQVFFSVRKRIVLPPLNDVCKHC